MEPGQHRGLSTNVVLERVSESELRVSVTGLGKVSLGHIFIDPFLLFKSKQFKGSIFFFNWAFGIHREYEKVEFFKGGEKSSQHSSFCL